MKTKVDTQIDELYALPLDQFTGARNALAKTLSGKHKTQVAALVKPSLAMWVINQLYWQDAPTYNALIDASEKLRGAHRSALNGRKADTDKANELHRTTLEKAFARAVAIAQNKGVRLTPTVQDTVRRTLSAQPSDEAPGRLTREPAPVGFSLLTGIKPRPIEAAGQHDRGGKKEDKQNDRLQREAEARARREAEKARRAQEKREQAIREAEQALREAERRLAALKG